MVIVNDNILLLIKKALKSRATVHPLAIIQE